MGDGNKSRGKISLGGLTKGMSSSGSASGGFPSFRFSPENEEISEILHEVSSLPTFANTAAPDERLSESLPDSPKAGTGDTSPIKEYLRKNWANKWDKKSLSLDLDLKEKILAAIDDKRKSIVSHFIPEETAGLIIPTSSSGSVTEHTGVVVSGESTPVPYSNSTYNSSAILFDNTTQKVSANLSQSTGDNSSTSSEDFEEIGLDYLANMTTPDHADDARDQVIPFTVGADRLQDIHSDLLIPRMDSRHYREYDWDDDDDDDDEPDELEISTVIKNMIAAVVVHEWTKYLLALVGAGLFIPFNVFIAALYWFVLGVIVTIILIQSLADGPTTSKTKTGSSVSITEVPNYTGELTIPTSPDISQLKTDVSQGWMTEYEGEYDPVNNNIRSNRIVFVKLEGSSLTISYPQSKYRIPKRRLWSDPPIPNVISFARHSVYNISSCEVFIAPERLAKRRAWNKKYPIGIRLPKYSLVSIHSPTEPPPKPLPAGPPTAADETVNHHQPRSSSPVAGGPPKQHEEQHTDQSHSHKSSHKRGSIAREDVGDKVLYLFTRTDREKDDWYRRLVTAAVRKDHSYGTRLHVKEDRILRAQYFSYMRSLIPSLNEFNETERKEAAAAQKSAQQPSAGPAPHSPDKKHKKTESKPKEEVPIAVAGPSTAKSPTTPRDNIDVENIITITQNPVFLNALLGRIFFDFLRSQHWTNQVSSLIQKKLNYIRRPQFLGVLLVRDLDMGRSIPYIQRVSAPVIDAQGLWVDCDITYEGNLTLILETNLDLMKLRRSPTNEDEPAHPRMPGTSGHTHHPTSSSEGAGSEGHTARTVHGGNMYDSEADDSGESSEEEEYDPDDFILHENTDAGPSTENSALKPSRGTRFLRMAEKLANSNFVNDVKVIKKAIANVANTPLVLSVELKSCVGTLAFNIPHPPTDRVWIAFRNNPKMVLVCKPKFGERSLNLTHVTEFIRKKLLHEFQRVLVLPNMDDITIPLMEFKLPTS